MYTFIQLTLHSKQYTLFRVKIRITIQDTSCSVCCSTAANPFSRRVMVNRMVNFNAVAPYLSGFVELFLQSRYRHDSDWTSAVSVLTPECDVLRCKYAQRYSGCETFRDKPMYTGNHHTRRLIISADHDASVASCVRFRLSSDYIKAPPSREPSRLVQRQQVEIRGSSV